MILRVDDDGRSDNHDGLGDLAIIRPRRTRRQALAPAYNQRNFSLSRWPIYRNFVALLLHYSGQRFFNPSATRWQPVRTRPTRFISLCQPVRNPSAAASPRFTNPSGIGFNPSATRTEPVRRNSFRFTNPSATRRNPSETRPHPYRTRPHPYRTRPQPVPNPPAPAPNPPATRPVGHFGDILRRGLARPAFSLPILNFNRAESASFCN